MGRNDDGLMSIFDESATCKQREVSAESNEAQALVSKFKANITQTTIVIHKGFL